MTISDVTMHDIYLARKKIAPVIRRTSLVNSSLLTARVGSSVYLKLENLQETGSFKIRGAANKMLNLTTEEKKRGVVTGSSGNHGRAVAFVKIGCQRCDLYISTISEHQGGCDQAPRR